MGQLSLRTKLVLVSLSIQILILGALFINSLRVIEDQLALQMEMRIQAVERAYKTAVAVPLVSRDYATLRDILEGWKTADDILYLTVSDQRGKVVAAVGWPEGQELPVPSSVQDGGATVHVAFDVDFQEVLYGKVQYGLSLAFLQDARAALIQKSVVFALLAIVLSLVLLLLTAYWLTRNLVSLSAASRQIADGDFSARISLRGDDEVAMVGRSFNAMAEAVQSRMDALNYAASHDTLTGLHNRRAFEMELMHELDTRLPGKVIVFYIDLDQFKLVNDTSGHTAGDSLLQHLSRVMQARFSFGFLARLGGDEFGMILCNLSIEEAEQRAQSVIDDIRSLPFSWEGRTFRIGASIGIAQSSPELRTITDLLMAADTACYAAKERGRNRAQLYLPTDLYFQQRQLDFLSLTQISDALGAGRMELHAQRIVSLKPHLSDYAEVLVRMKSEDGTLIQPGRFIPAAERYGLIPLIDRWVIEHSLMQLRDWQLAGKPIFKLNVNLSGLTLADTGLAEFIEHMTERYGIIPATLGFEITESCAIAQLDQALSFFDFCQKKGFSLALDDFGSGLSSFGYLKRFKVQTLKIDGMFVRNVDFDLDDRAVVDSMVRLSHLRNLTTVAEFVTSADVLAVVKALDVDYAQGYALHIPEQLVNLMP